MRQILIINGHPDKQSFNHALAGAYTAGAKLEGIDLHSLDLVDLAFNPSLAFGYRKRTELEPNLLDAIQLMQQADHLVWVFPVWWYGYPALMKGFIDRTFLPGITFEYVKGKARPKKLLTGKTARLIITADTPRWYDVLFMKSPAIHQFKKGTLQFCGVKPVKVTYISPIKDSSMSFRTKWLEQIHLLGQREARFLST